MACHFQADLGGKMKKILFLFLTLSVACCAVWAGDVASFVDKGFTEDGKYYIFGQYGKTDKKFQGWAEIYQVDIAANDYADGGVFKTNPSVVTAGKNGKEVYEALEAKNFSYLKNIPAKKANMDHVLYILDDVNKTGTDEIVFSDFRGSDVEKRNTYHIQLIPTFYNSGKKLSSSFYIMLEKKDSSGNVITRQKIGSPDIKRRGVTNYKIEKIMCDDSEKNLIFVIEKTMEDDTGVSIRYMVEAAQF